MRAHRGNAEHANHIDGLKEPLPFVWGLCRDKDELVCGRRGNMHTGPNIGHQDKGRDARAFVVNRDDKSWEAHDLAVPVGAHAVRGGLLARAEAGKALISATKGNAYFIIGPFKFGEDRLSRAGIT